MATVDGTYGTMSDRETDRARSFDDWNKLHAKVLRHKCNTYGLDITGLKKVIRRRLVTLPPKLKQMKNRAKLTQRHPRNNLPWGGPPAMTSLDLNNDVVLDYNSSDDNDALSDGSNGRRAFFKFSSWLFSMLPVIDDASVCALKLLLLAIVALFCRIFICSFNTGCFNRIIIEQLMTINPT